MPPLISICIPAYKNVTYLERLLESIAKQDFQDYEVIVTDDSPDNQVEELVGGYQSRLHRLSYWKNEPASGMPENWNVAIGRASGLWIKIMHDDDWFQQPDSLSLFAAQTATKADFIFSDYENYYLNAKGQTLRRQIMEFPESQRHLIEKEPLVLLANNRIGPPSVCMVRRSSEVRYDRRLRWRVDIDYYTGVLRQNAQLIRIDQPLIAVGMNPDQVTNITKNRPEVELPEAYILLKKYGVAPFKRWQVYDAWWRMLRNMQIYSKDILYNYVNENWDPVVLQMVVFLQRLPKFLLKSGVTSKIFMFLSYFTNTGRR